jgi:hypothetical protein
MYHEILSPEQAVETAAWWRQAFPEPGEEVRRGER